MAIAVPTLDGPQVSNRPLSAPQVQSVGPDMSGARLQQQTLGAVGQLVQQETEHADQAALMDAEAKLSQHKLDLMFNPEAGVYSKKGQSALDITNQTLPQFDKQAEQISMGLTNQRQKDQFQRIAQSQRLGLSGELNRYEYTQRNEFYDQTDKTNIATSMDGALKYAEDPSQVAFYQSKGSYVIGEMGMRKGLPPETIIDQQNQFNSQVNYGVINKLATSDPLQAQQYYAKTAATMTAEDQAKAQKLLGTSVRQQMGSELGKKLWDTGNTGGPGLINSIIQAESGGNQNAVSPKGAVGKMQLMPATAEETAKELGIPYSPERLASDPNYNVALGTAYLNKMLGRYDGNQTLAVAAYNAGPGAVDKWIKEYGDPRGTKKQGVYLGPANADGMMARGNIDLNARPVVKNADGSISTVRSMSVNFGDGEVLIPTVAADGSRILSDDEAIAQYKKTGQFLGKFKTPDQATAYAEALHEEQAKQYLPQITDAEFISKIPYEETRNYTAGIMGKAAPTIPASTKYGAGLAWINDNVTDPALKKFAMDDLDNRKKASDQQLAGLYDQASKIVVDQGFSAIPAQLLNNLPGDEVLKLQKMDDYKRKGTSPQTDYGKLQEFLNMPPEKLASLSLAKDVVPYLGTSDLSRVTTIYEAAVRGDMSPQKVEAGKESVIQTTMAMAGIITGKSQDALKPGNLQKQQQFRNAMQERQDSFKAKHGRDPNVMETEDLANQLLLKVKLTGGGVMFGDSAAQTLWETRPEDLSSAYLDKASISLDKIPPADRRVIVDLLRKEGVQASEANIIARYVNRISGLGVKIK